MDDATVLAARYGDRPAQARLLRWLQDPWYRLSLGLLGDVEQAREATQETAVRFLRQAAGFRGDSQLRTWALGIAINVAREMRRSPHVRTGGLEDWDGVGDVSYGPRRPAPAAFSRRRGRVGGAARPVRGRCWRICRSGSARRWCCGSSKS